MAATAYGSRTCGVTASAYRGGTVPGFPNLFISSAPNYSPGHGAGHNFGVEVMVHYVRECLADGAANASAIEVTPEAFGRYVQQIDGRAAQKHVWCHTRPRTPTIVRRVADRHRVSFRLIDVWQSHPGSDRGDFILT